MAIPFIKDQNDDRTPEGNNRHGFPQPSLETALCLASVMADLEMSRRGMDPRHAHTISSLGSTITREIHADYSHAFLGLILDSHA